jgi:hypothetical protein
MNKKDSIISSVVNISFGLLFIGALFLLKTWLLLLIYNWFIVPVFPLKELGMNSMYGISFLTEFLGGKMNVFHTFEQKPENVSSVIGEMLFKYGLFLAIIYIAHFLIIF